MCIIVTEEDLCKKHVTKSALFCQYAFLPQKCCPAAVCRGRSKMTLNIIFVLIIITHAQGFESIKKYGGREPLAAP